MNKFDPKTANGQILGMLVGTFFVMALFATLGASLARVLWTGFGIMLVSVLVAKDMNKGEK